MPPLPDQASRTRPRVCVAASSSQFHSLGASCDGVGSLVGSELVGTSVGPGLGGGVGDGDTCLSFGLDVRARTPVADVYHWKLG